MSDNSENNLEKVINSIYGDTKFFIDAITDEYGFYGSFIEAMRTGNTTMNVSRRIVHKKLEDQWMNAIEACLPTLDYVMRNYSTGIEEREEVLPIELSKKIGNRSIRHLAQHTDYINEVNGDTITPSKILNVYNEGTVLTYENKFINTLIQHLYTFVEKRYNALMGNGAEETGMGLEFDSSFKFGSSEGKLSLKIEVNDPSSGNTKENPPLERIRRLRQTVAMYLDSPFVKMMGNSYIHPPVMRTNAILKNKYLRECLDLWNYIETYENLGYLIETEEQAEKPNDSFIKDIYSLMSLQYLVFDYNMHHGFKNTPEVLTSKRSDQPLTPKLLTHFQKVETKDYNAYDIEYRKVVNIYNTDMKRGSSKFEAQIRNAIDVALNAEREMTAFKKPSKNESK